MAIYMGVNNKMIERDYFLTSFRMNKNFNDFDLKKVEDNLFISIDSSKYQKIDLIDNGWGFENTFMLLPKKNFKESIELLFKCSKDNNIYGFGNYIVQTFSEQLYYWLTQQENIESIVKIYGKKDCKKRLKIMLDQCSNLFSIIGKHFNEINSDYNKTNLLKSELIKQQLL